MNTEHLNSEQLKAALKQAKADSDALDIQLEAGKKIIQEQEMEIRAMKKKIKNYKSKILNVMLKERIMWRDFYAGNTTEGAE